MTKVNDNSLIEERYFLDDYGLDKQVNSGAQFSPMADSLEFQDIYQKRKWYRKGLEHKALYQSRLDEAVEEVYATCLNS